MSIAKVSWGEHPEILHAPDGRVNPAGVADLVGFVTDAHGEPAGCVVTPEGRIAVVRLSALRFEGWPE